MDERHWWIATKVQESFKLNSTTDPVALEKVFLTERNLSILRKFLEPDGPEKVLFVTDKNAPNSIDNLHVASNVHDLKGMLHSTANPWYFFVLKKRAKDLIEISNIENQLLCGQIKGNPMECLAKVFYGTLLPAAEVIDNWGTANLDSKRNILINMEKSTKFLYEQSVKKQESSPQLLTIPQSIRRVSDFPGQSLDIEHCENILTQWMDTIDTILGTYEDEKDPYTLVGPSAERSFWKKKQHTLHCLTEQLRSSECKAVIGTLITGKSSHLKRWKAIDISITDAVNSTRERVKYLDSLVKYFEQMEHPRCTPQRLMSVTLPGLMETMKMMDSASRYHARAGFLGSLLAKVTNQLVLVCRRYLKPVAGDTVEELWSEIMQQSKKTCLADFQELSVRQLRQKLEHLEKEARNERLMGVTRALQREKSSVDLGVDENKLIGRIKICILLADVYQDELHVFKEYLASQGAIAPSSSSSLSNAPVSTTITPLRKRSIQGSASSQRTVYQGVSLNDDSIILHPLVKMSQRLKSMSSILRVFFEICQLIEQTRRLPKPRREHFINEDEEDTADATPELLNSTEGAAKATNGKGSPLPILKVTLPAMKGLDDKRKESIQMYLDVIAEDQEELLSQVPHVSTIEESGEHEQSQGKDNDEMEKRKGHKGTSRKDEYEQAIMDDLKLLRKHYKGDEEDPGISQVIKSYLDHTLEIFSDIDFDVWLCVRPEKEEEFDKDLRGYLDIVNELDHVISCYIYVVFMRSMITPEALEVLIPFMSVEFLTCTRTMMQEKMVELFLLYEEDLADVKETYEEYKHQPQRPRNSPPISGAIAWSRKLLKAIEEPMRVFQRCKAVCHANDYGRLVRMHNKIATALVTFEALYLNNWNEKIGLQLASLKNNLLSIDSQTRRLRTNMDPGLIELMEEGRWLTNMRIEIPACVTQLLQNENVIKRYSQKVEECINSFYNSVERIPENLRHLFQRQLEETRKVFLPGLSTLTWNSFNIDTFIHKVEVVVSMFRQLVESVNHILSSEVEISLNELESMFLVDFEYAQSHLWEAGDFLNAMEEKNSDQIEKMKALVRKIECALSTIFEQVANLKKPLERKQPAVTSNSSNNSQYYEDEKATSEITKYYFDKLYASILKQTQATLKELVISTGCEPMSTGPYRADTTFISDSIGIEKDMSSISMRQISSLREDTELEIPVVSVNGVIEEKDEEPSHHSSLRNQSESLLVDGKSYHSPLSRLDHLSQLSWKNKSTNNSSCIRFSVSIAYDVPKLILDPQPSNIQTTISRIAQAIVDSCKSISWFKESQCGTHIANKLNGEPTIQDLISQIDGATDGLWPYVQVHLRHLQAYNFLWEQNLPSTFQEFLQHHPTEFQIKREVSHMQHLEEQLHRIPTELLVGCICLQTHLVREVLLGYAFTWKATYASTLHREAKKQLTNAVSYRVRTEMQLQTPVETLDELNEALQLLEDLSNLENKIDAIYLPIENMYAMLDSFGILIPREEMEQVHQLREQWMNLLRLADNSRGQLLKERKAYFEQELDKQLKNFVVEVMQFRNSFDAHGPGVPGIDPIEAVSRLQEFQQLFNQYALKRRTLDSVCKLFGFPPKTFSELDRTGEELQLLSLLYGLFKKFIKFSNDFRDTLWAEIDLEISSRDLDDLWDECLALPSKLKEWEAYQDLRARLQAYLTTLPLLKRLQSKEIRNRHWLLVMNVTGSSFLLESSVFKLQDLMDIGLAANRTEIEEICIAAEKEQLLESRLKQIQEEWTEQVLAFVNHKRRGPVLLEQNFTERLLEQLEDSQTLIATMLTSKHITPLRDEAASWTERLRQVAEVLDIWLQVQSMWFDLEAVFSTPENVRELTIEAKQFERLDKSYVKYLKRANETKNVLQCCLGGEVPRTVLLRHMLEEMETIFKRLTQFLDSKRQRFPRLCYVPDSLLLNILSRTQDLESVKPHLKFLFSAVHDIESRKRTMREMDSPSFDAVPRSASMRSATTRDDNFPHKFRRGNTGIAGHAGGASTGAASFTGVPGDDLFEDTNTVLEMIGVKSLDGDSMSLDHGVYVTGTVETWLSELHFNVAETLQRMLEGVVKDIVEGGPLEEIAYKYPSQICRMGLLYFWTRESEVAINDIKNERKSLPNWARRFNTVVCRLPTVLHRGAWKTIDDTMDERHKLRLKNMIDQALYLRDCLDAASQRKIRDSADFDWRRNMRCYLHPSENEARVKRPFIYVLDEKFDYGCEFHGGLTTLAYTPLSERCFLAMVLAMQQCRGQLLQGSPGVGKTELVRTLSQLIGYHLVQWEAFSNTLSATVLSNVINKSGGVTHSDNSENTAVQSRDVQQQKSHLARILTGLAAEGSWGLLKYVQTFSCDLWSLLLQYSHSIFSAIRSSASSAILGDIEGSIQSTTALFLTATSPSMTLAFSKTASFPTQAKSHFRCMSLLKPDVYQILRCKAMFLTFKSPQVLAARLKVIGELGQEQFPQEYNYLFSLPSLIRCLTAGDIYKRHVREMNATRDMLSSATGSQQATSHVSGGYSDCWPPHKDKVVNPLSAGDRRLGPKMSVATTGTLKTNFSKKNATPNPLTPSAKLEHGFVLAAALETFVPALPTEHQPSMRSIIMDIFNGIEEPTKIRSRSKESDLKKVLTSIADDQRVTANKAWIAKCLQIYYASNTNQSIVLYGPAGNGKTTCVTAVISGLSQLALEENEELRKRKTADLREETEREWSNHRIQTFYPEAFSNLSTLYGHSTPDGEWIDGLITWSIKKANRNQSVTWFCFDGEVNGLWCENILSFFNPQNPLLNMPNGTQIPVSSRIKLLFETESLRNASPETLAKSSLIFVGDDVIPWKSLAQAWLRGRNKSDKEVLQKTFERSMDSIMNFMSTDSKNRIELSPIAMFRNCLALLGAMLTENKEMSSDLHMERIFVFCVLWSFGAFMRREDQKIFHEFLKGVTGALPDDDRDICVFDYYVDESGEWDAWAAKVSETPLPTLDQVTLTGQLCVPTPTMMRNQLLLDLAYISKCNVLLLGPHGSGKTILLEDFTNHIDGAVSFHKRIACSSYTRVDEVQSYLEKEISHRQGFVYGGKDGKRLLFIVDDMYAGSSHLKPPLASHQSTRLVQHTNAVNELLRAITDRKLLLTREKPYTWRQLEDVELIASVATSDSSSITLPLPHNRLLRQFLPINVSAIEGDTLRSIFRTVVHVQVVSRILKGENRGEETNEISSLHLSETLEKVVQLSCSLLEDCHSTLINSQTPGREHYLFSLQYLDRMVTALQRLSEEQLKNEEILTSFSLHELCRVFRDSLCRHSDLVWFDDSLQQHCKEQNLTLDTSTTSRSSMSPFQDLFITFENESQIFEHAVGATLAGPETLSKSTSHSPQGKSVSSISSPSKVRSCLTAYRNRYNEEFGNEHLSVNLSDLVIRHLIRLHRILTVPVGGHMILVGAIGSHLSNLCRLAAHMVNMPIMSVSTHNYIQFLDGLRTAVRIAGLENKSIILLLTGRGLTQNVYLDALHSIVVSGYFPALFSKEELDGIIQTLSPTLKKAGLPPSTDVQYYFQTQVQRNLHLLLCLPPGHDILTNSFHTHPGFLTRCQINWFCEWPRDALVQEARFFVQQLASEMQLKLTRAWSTIEETTTETPSTADKQTSSIEAGSSQKKLEKIVLEDMEKNVVRCLADIHSFLLQECNQIPWAGVQSAEIQLTNVRVLEKKKDAIRIQTSSVANHPYSKVIVKELIQQNHTRSEEKGEQEVSIGPITYQRFLECFQYLYTRKRYERRKRVNLLQHGLLSMQQGRHDIHVLQQENERFKKQYSEAKNAVQQLLQKLRDKVTLLEKVRASRGEESALTVFLQIHNEPDEHWEADPLLQRGQPDQYDAEFEKVHEEILKNRQKQVKDELNQAKQRYEIYRKELDYAREQVNYWRAKVDRPCIERIRAFQNPPFLVGQVMEMVFVLIGKLVPSLATGPRSGPFPPGMTGGASRQGKTADGQDDNVSSRMSANSAAVGRAQGVGNRNAGGDKLGQSASGNVAMGGFAQKGAGRELQEKVDKVAWKQMQQSMTDSIKFMEMLHNISWEDGLEAEIQSAVESYLIKGRDGQLGVTGEGTLLESAETTNIKASKRIAQNPMPSLQLSTADEWDNGSAGNLKGASNKGTISIAAAKYASEDAATLVHYTIALVEYSRRCGPLRQSLNRIQDLKREIEEAERRKKESVEGGAKVSDQTAGATTSAPVDYSNQDMNQLSPEELEAEVQQLQGEYDKAVMRKYQLGVELQSMEKRLQFGGEMVSILQRLEESWEHYCHQYATEVTTLADSVLAAAYITYGSQMHPNERARIARQCLKIISEDNSLPVSQSLQSLILYPPPPLTTTSGTSRDVDWNPLLYFLFREKADLERLPLLDLPCTELQMQNALPLLVDSRCQGAWPLLCDSTGQAIRWVQRYMQHWPLRIVSYRNLRSKFESSLSEGAALLITHCDLHQLANDRQIRPVLLNHHRFLNSTTPLKVMLEDHEVECQPQFRLFLHCDDAATSVPTSLSALTHVINFSQSRDCLEEAFLLRFITNEKVRLHVEIQENIASKIDCLYQLTNLEEKILQNLHNCDRLMTRLPVIRSLIDMKKQYDAVEENLARINTSHDNYRRAKDTYRPIAKRGAICFETRHSMRYINPCYFFSFEQYQDIFDLSVQHSDRTSTKVVIDRLTLNSYQNVMQSLLEKDRAIYELLLALEVCDSNSQVNVGEREFIISPSLGSAVVSAHMATMAGSTTSTQGSGGETNRATETKFMQMKKPFDWMLDDQYTNLQYLATYFPWFQAMFERMSKDGRETQWRSLVENDQPENTPLPDKMDESFTPLQRFCVLRAVRGDRIMQMARIFVTSVLGKLCSVDYNWSRMLSVEEDVNKYLHPTILLYKNSASVAECVYLKEADSQNVDQPLIIYLGSGDLEDVKQLRNSFSRFMESPNCWLLVSCVSKNGYSSSLIEALINCASDFTQAMNNNTNSQSEDEILLKRFFIAVSMIHPLPNSVLQNYPHVVVDPPISIREFMLHSMVNHVNPEMHKAMQSRPEWPAILHNLLLLHGIINLRGNFPLSGWNVTEGAFTTYIGNAPDMENILDTVEMLQRELANESQSGNTSGGIPCVVNPLNAVSLLGAPHRANSPGAHRSASPGGNRPGSGGGKLEEAIVTLRGTSWPEIRFILTEILYSANIEDYYDQLSLGAIVDFWISPSSLKREFELSKLKYRIPAAFFSQHARYSNLVQSIDGIAPYFFDNQEACHLHSSIENVLGTDQYVFTRLNFIYDHMPASETLKHQLFDHPPIPRTGPLQSMVNSNSQHPMVSSMGVLASTTLIHWRSKKEIELWELCHNLLPRIPKAYSREYIQERVKKIGGSTPFNLIIVKELKSLFALVNAMRSSLMAIKTAVEVDQLGDCLPNDDLRVADSLMHSQLPEKWRELAGESAPPPHYVLNTWLTDLQARSQHLERILVLGREKNPAYWLSAFTEPEALLSLWKQDALSQQMKSDRSGNLENVVFNVEITARDKDHLRDPAQDGYFIYGLHLSGCAWDKASGELSDTPSKTVFTSLPVMLLTCVPVMAGQDNLTATLTEVSKPTEIFSCPVYPSRSSRDKPIMEINLKRDGVPASRWSLRGVHITLRPY